MNQPFNSEQIDAVHRRRLAERQGWATEERVAVDFSQLPLCQEAAAYLAWIEEVVAEARRWPSYEVLDRALLAVLKEYQYRKASVQDHRWIHSCIPYVFEIWTDKLTYEQQELYRHRFLDPQPPDLSHTPKKEMHIGEAREG
jgi:hypothetical protein